MPTHLGHKTSTPDKVQLTRDGQAENLACKMNQSLNGEVCACLTDQWQSIEQWLGGAEQYHIS